jgi:hypothetical protein
VSYIAAGWPPEDIYVVENTGVMFANKEGKLTLQNPFYLNHTQLELLGVNVIIVSVSLASVLVHLTAYWGISYGYHQTPESTTTNLRGSKQASALQLNS